MFYADWFALVRTLTVAALAYAALLVILRVSGKRTLSKLNAFDLVVTVALGSTLASVAVSPQVTLSDGATAFLVLVALQYVIASLSVRFPPFQRAIKARPALLVRDGRVLDHALADQRVTRSEILQAVRQHGHPALSGVAAVVLETDGSLSVIPASASVADASALADVAGWDGGA